MASEEIGLVLPTQNLNSQLVFENDPFRCAGPPERLRAAAVDESGPKTTRESTGLYFQPQGTSTEFCRNIYDSSQHRSIQSWNGNDNGQNQSSQSGDGSDGDEDDDDDDDDDDEEDHDDEVVEGLVNKNNNSSNTRGHSSEKIGIGKMTHISSFGK